MVEVTTESTELSPSLASPCPAAMPLQSGNWHSTHLILWVLQTAGC